MLLQAPVFLLAWGSHPPSLPNQFYSLLKQALKLFTAGLLLPPPSGQDPERFFVSYFSPFPHFLSGSSGLELSDFLLFVEEVGRSSHFRGTV